MTQASKGGNLGTDLDFLIQNDLLDYGAYDPLTSYEPVDAPGLRRMTQWSQGSPYQQYVAEWFRGGRSANELLTDLQSMVAQPSGDEFETAILQSMPKGQFYDEATSQYTMTDQPDMRAVGDELRSFENDVLSDPQYTLGPDGQPVTATTEDSPARQALLEAGYTTTPGQGYDPYSFAPAGTMERDQETLAARGPAQAALVKAAVEQPLALLDQKRAAIAYQQWLARLEPEGGAGAGPQGAVMPGGAATSPAINRNATGSIFDRPARVGSPAINRNAPLIDRPARVGGSTGPRDNSTPIMQRGPRVGARGGSPSGAPPLLDRESSQGLTAGFKREAGEAQARSLLARRNEMAAEDANVAASDQLLLARRAAAMRQSLADHLLRQGRSPFDDERNRSNAAIYGMGR
jgi:hypothetical protein